MTCDDVFEVLTRGPFPAGDADDVLVEEHLSHCLDCRRLAKALRPAVELFQEAISPDENANLPGYRGSAAFGTWAALGDLSERESAGGWAAIEGPWRRLPPTNRGRNRPAGVPTPVTRRGRPPMPPAARLLPQHAGLLRFAAAVLLGVAAAAGARGYADWQAASADPPPTGPVLSLAASGEPHPRDVQWLASLTLPRECRPTQLSRADAGEKPSAGLYDLAMSDAGVGHLDCCTHCHRAATAGLIPLAAQSVVARACRACH